MAGGWEGAGNGPGRKSQDSRTPISGHTPPRVDFRTECRHSGANPLEVGEAPAYHTKGRSAHPTYGRAP